MVYDMPGADPEIFGGGWEATIDLLPWYILYKNASERGWLATPSTPLDQTMYACFFALYIKGARARSHDMRTYVPLRFTIVLYHCIIHNLHKLIQCTSLKGQLL